MRARLILPFVLAFAASCGGDITEIECTSNDDCAPGLVCIAGDCKRPGDTGDGDSDVGDDDTDVRDLDTDVGDDDVDTGDIGEDPANDPGTDPADDPANDPGADPTSDTDADVPTPSVCGDGAVTGDEACDDGDDNSDERGGACRTDCTLPFCGDDITDPGEACDGGELNSDTEPNSCRTDCTLPSCGDGVIDDARPWSEACDGDENCDAQCELVPSGSLCLNDSDGSRFIDGTWFDREAECDTRCGGLGGSTDPEGAAACMEGCMRDALGLTDRCASCWSVRTREVYATCPSCEDPRAEACITCLDENPDAGMQDACTGAPWDAVEVDGCQFHGEPCDAFGEYVGSGYWCSPLTGECAANCAADGRTVSDPDATCPRGSVCLGVGGDPEPDPETGRVAVAVCIDGNCEPGGAGVEVCDGLVNIFRGELCTGGACTCRSFGPGTSFCAREGDVASGERCAQSDDCGEGAVCARGICTPLCASGMPGACDDAPASESCADPSDCTCQPLYGDLDPMGPGECATPCDEYADGGCPLGTACAPTWDAERILRWYCAGATVDEPAGIGEVCDVSIGNVGSCESGGICLGFGDSDPVCSRVCDPDAEGREPGSADRVCEAGEDCWPTSIDGLGLCRDACEPFPRRGRNGYECESSGTTCSPYFPDADDLTVVRGVCDVDFDGVPAGAPCDAVGLSTSCTDGAFCLYPDDSVEGDPDRVATCRPQCDPFAEDACDEGVCAGTWITVIGLAAGLCSTEFNDAGIFEPCERPGLPCRDHGSACLLDDDGEGGTCTRVCRVGGDDCLPWGATCLPASRTDGTPTREGIGFCER